MGASTVWEPKEIGQGRRRWINYFPSLWAAIVALGPSQGVHSTLQMDGHQGMSSLAKEQGRPLEICRMVDIWGQRSLGHL
jgi:hypothetical protein